MSQQKRRVAVIGATGIAGQQFMAALADHPWFEVVALAGSPRSAGKSYQEALRSPNGQLQWWQHQALPEKFAKLKITEGQDLDVDKVDLVFTAIESDAAKVLEPLYAKHKPTISTASAFRMEADVPLLVPGVNSQHKELIKAQQLNRGWKGFVVPIPNCTVYGLACTLAPIERAFGVRSVIMTSMQAVSGAGRNGGVLSLDIIDNLIPHIKGEEEKVEREAQKILGNLVGATILPASFPVSSTCTRVAVLDGHTEAVFVATKSTCSVDQVKAAFREYVSEARGLPSAPKDFFTLHEDPFHPQPRVDRDKDGGMTTHVGRIREDQVLGGVKYVLLSHNTKAGAAKGALLVAESLVKDGLI